MLTGTVLLVLLLVFGGRAYVQWRMEQVSGELLTLAKQLSFTQDSMLAYEVRTRDFNIVFPWNSYCEAVLYYTTSMTAEAFGQRLRQVSPELAANKWIEEDSDQLYTIIDLTVGTTDASKAHEDYKRRLMTSHYWFMRNESSRSVSLYETANVDVSLEYKGRRIQDNIVRLYVVGGSFPIWMNCPVKTLDLTHRS